MNKNNFFCIQFARSALDIFLFLHFFGFTLFSDFFGDYIFFCWYNFTLGRICTR